MNAVIALTEFCEHHGPRVVMCCQPVPADATDTRNYDGRMEFLTPSPERLTTSAGDSIETSTTPLTSDVGQPSTSIIDLPPAVDEERCAGCSSFGRAKGVVLPDLRRGVDYVSSEVPISDRVRGLVKESCLRSLSVEVASPLHISNVSAPCFVPSSTAGVTADGIGQGVVLFGDEEDGFTLAYTFKLKDALARGFHRTYSLIVISADKLMLIGNYDFYLSGLVSIAKSLQSMTLEVFRAEHDTATDRLMNNADRASRLPQKYHPKEQFSLKRMQVRSLAVITNNGEIFTLLHEMMSRLLQDQSLLQLERALEGPPTQDMMVALEQQEEEMSGGIKLSLDAQRVPSCHLANLRWLSRRIGPQHFISLLQVLVLGGQIVVRGEESQERTDVLLALVNLLPIGCIKLAPDADAYLQSYKCNLLGCGPVVDIPTEVLSDSYILAVSHCDNGTDEVGGENTITTLKAAMICVESAPGVFGMQPPAIVLRYQKLIDDPTIDLATLSSAIAATRSEWLDKAKLLFQLKHLNQLNTTRIPKLLRCSEDDSNVLRFWQAGLSRSYKRAVLNTIHNEKEDPLISGHVE